MVKEDENVHARPSRIATRTKPAASTTGGTSRAGSAQDATAQGKRKREALGEVTTKVTNNRLKGADAKGKEKEKDDLTKPGKYTAGSRQPLRTVASRSKATGASENAAEEPPADEMAVDPPSNAVPVVLVPAPPRAGGRVSHLRKPSAGHIKVELPERVEPEPEEEPLHKKRRTSSDTGDEEQHLAPVEEEQDGEVVDAAENEEETEDWDDLDKEDADDPLMVSEYVLEIFDYMKELEVP